MASFLNDTNPLIHNSPFDYINSFLALVAIFLNIAVLQLCRSRISEYSYMWFIGSLALADVMNGVQGFILSQRYLVAFESMCVMVPAWGVITTGAAITSHPLLALNRYVAILKPAWFSRLFENRYAVAGLLVFNWTLPTVFMVVDFAEGCLGRDHATDICFFNSTPQQLGCNLPKAVHFLSCYIISAFCYVRIYSVLHYHQKQLASSGTVSTLATDSQLLRLMALHALVPLCIHLPGLAAVVVPQVRLHYPGVVKLILMLFMLESILNAVLTLFIVKQFRTAVFAVVHGFYSRIRYGRQAEESEAIPLYTAEEVETSESQVPAR